MQSVTDFEIVPLNQTESLDIRVYNTLTEDLTNVYGTSSFNLIDISDDSSKDSGNFGPTGSSKMTRSATGIYQYSFDASTYSDEYWLKVNCVLENETVKNNLFVKSATSRHFAYAAQLRGQVDKARKSVSDQIINMGTDSGDPSIQFFYGYDDKHLIFYLERGLQYLNSIPPYTGLTIDIFPFAQYGTILIDAATIAALEAQGIFAIDTDFNYSLGGNSLVIDHFTKLSSAVSQILGRFQKTAISWKQTYRRSGTVLFQWMPGGVRAARMLSALPGSFWSKMLSSAYM